MKTLLTVCAMTAALAFAGMSDTASAGHGCYSGGYGGYGGYGYGGYGGYGSYYSPSYSYGGWGGYGRGYYGGYGSYYRGGYGGWGGYGRGFTYSSPGFGFGYYY